MNDNHYQQNLYMKINLTITGCKGRMGQQLIKSSNKNKIFKIVSLTENFKINNELVQGDIKITCMGTNENENTYWK